MALVRAHSSQSGYLAPHPLVAIINGCSKQLLGLSDRFGLNPKSRQGQRVELQAEDDDFERYLREGRNIRTRGVKPALASE